MTTKPLTAPIILELERLLRRRHRLASGLLFTDAFERWGPKSGPEYDEVMAAQARDNAEHVRVSAELQARATAARADAPADVALWAQAHVDLLTRFLARHADDASRDTARFVATKERDEWEQVRSGQRTYVDENCYYIDIPEDERMEWFGDLTPLP